MADSNTYRAFALFVQGERVLNCTEYTPVDMKIIEDDFKTGAVQINSTASSRHLWRWRPK